MNQNVCIGKLETGNNCPNQIKIGKYCKIHYKQMIKNQRKMLMFEIREKSRKNNEKNNDFESYNKRNEILYNDFMNKLLNMTEKGHKNLFIYKKPEMIKEWDFYENDKLNIDILYIRFSSHKVVSWICLKNHKPFKTSLNLKTAKIKTTSGCPECATESKRIHDKNFVNDFRENNKYKNKKQTGKIGDETEKYVFDLLENTRKYKKIEIVGNKAGKGDIKI